MSLPVPLAYAVFSTYFGLIFLSFGFVFRSIAKGQDVSKLFGGRAFLFLRTALGSLLCTWYFMFKYMHWSYTTFAKETGVTGVGQWLANTSLFEEAWTIVCNGRANWWWSSFICTWTIILTAVVWRESGRRNISHSWAYMLLGQLVAMSVSTSLFFAACALHPRVSLIPARAPSWLSAALVAALWTVSRTPLVVGTSGFLPNLLTMHGALLLPLLVPADNSPAHIAYSRVKRAIQLPFPLLYALLMGLSAAVHWDNHLAVLHLLPTSTLAPSASSLASRPLLQTLWNTLFSHPAQSSISMDVIWVLLALLALFFSSGSYLAIAAKGTIGLLVAAGVAVRLAGVPLVLVASLAPLALIGGIGGALMALSNVRTTNQERRKKLLDGLGLTEGPIPGTENQPPRMGKKKTVVGFWHPFCDAGGGGERVLWSAIAYLQREKPDVVSLVYTGDYPASSKQQIIEKVNQRFNIALAPKTLHFVPLPSRHLIGDTYWTRLTLLGQSLGSVWLVFEGLTGKDGVWGDVFIDSAGYAFTLPFVRLIAGSTTAIGTYTHYPTVSADMVKRVKTGAFGVESLGASKSALRTRLKLVYYHIFTSLYATCLLFSQYTMTNSSWTQAHIQSLLAKGRELWVAKVFLPAEVVKQTQCEVVYPPCDVEGLTRLGNLDKRKKQLVSLAQFRPEKEHHKQIRALAVLFERYPEHKKGEKKVSLTLMGGARHPADQARVETLKKLAADLKVQDNVEFLVNAPYPEIERRLGEASIGLNSMQDEHFGINVVEFMAAGLIPIVHASAGPKMDIVTPYNGQQTGYHAVTPEDFAERIHDALSISKAEERKMREAARGQARDKFSLEGFESGLEGAWEVLIRSLPKGSGSESAEVVNRAEKRGAARPVVTSGVRQRAGKGR